MVLSGNLMPEVTMSFTSSFTLILTPLFHEFKES